VWPPGEAETDKGHTDREGAKIHGEGSGHRIQSALGRPAIHDVIADANSHAYLQQLSLDFAALKCQMAVLLSEVEEV
jgi:hypothetical protein